MDQQGVLLFLTFTAASVIVSASSSDGCAEACWDDERRKACDQRDSTGASAPPAATRFKPREVERPKALLVPV